MNDRSDTTPRSNRSPAAQWLFVGTQHGGPGTGFSRARFDAATGRLGPFEFALEIDDPAFFVIHPDGRHLYTCNSGTPGGVTAVALDARTGDLTALNHTVAVGRGPSQLSLDRRGRFVLDANYGGGYVEVLSIRADGSMGELTARVSHDGRGADPVRQSRAYVHCVQTDPTNRFAIVADLGLDRVYVYRLDAGTGALVPHEPAFVSVRPGAGPRHLAWHPNGRWLYLVEELHNSVTVFGWDAEAGRLQHSQTLSTLPDGFDDDNTAAEVLVDAGGCFLYASNRGHDSIAVFAIDARHGTLTLVERVPSRGRTPRYMAFDATGQWLLVSNVDGNAVAVFQVDARTGTLSATAEPWQVRRPCGLALTPVSEPAAGARQDRV
jgi:6-phosphogluconolactonase